MAHDFYLVELPLRDTHIGVWDVQKWDLMGWFGAKSLLRRYIRFRLFV